MTRQTTEIEEIQKHFRSFYKSLYSTKVENLEEMYNVLGRYPVLTLNQDQTNYLKSPTTPKEIEVVTTTSPNQNKQTKNQPNKQTIHLKLSI